MLTKQIKYVKYESKKYYYFLNQNTDKNWD